MSSTMRQCASCKRNLPQSSYQSYQYSIGAGASQCATCILGHQATYTLSACDRDGGRYNKADEMMINQYDLDHPFAHGSFRHVAKGTYSKGHRTGQTGVVKWFKSGATFEVDYFILDITAVDKALEIMNRFNQAYPDLQNIRINVPGTWVFADGERKGERALVEPFIENYRKYNSNTGWADVSTTWGQILQALSHFSYAESGGQFLLCDLQGGINSNEVILSDPAIMSVDGMYGISDLGHDGMSSFFSHHRCNNWCHPHWMKPRQIVRAYAAVPHTTMIQSTRSARPDMLRRP
ncbi:kinase-like protein [Hypoxylon fragiforme]|uniref:kinase-like protein n=1 Tax=Hypoxylon fragiforme TaxID=63214 RepID=UPI0020C72DC7|nr:kinase-like protein [Hypoxylon fragiforme]KAI2607757.1 kinase-like protein [Hypoxylon fragiforme]